MPTNKFGLWDDRVRPFKFILKTKEPSGKHLFKIY